MAVRYLEDCGVNVKSMDRIAMNSILIGSNNQRFAMSSRLTAHSEQLLTMVRDLPDRGSLAAAAGA
jgi:hypothetical protein